MTFDPGLTQEMEIDNTELCEIFRCSPQGGIRPSRTTNTLVIVSNHLKSIYVDEWTEGVLHYTGTGREGDQRLDYGSNKTLATSRQTGIDIFLFEVFQDKLYRFVGKVELAGDPSSERQPDQNGAMRTVWVFPLRPVDGNPPPLPKDVLEELQRKKESAARRLSDRELLERAKRAKRGTRTRTVVSDSYERNPYVSEYAKRQAEGICQLCETSAPFTDKKGELYLEAHHVKWLSKGGDDTIDNTVALCPNCHRKMHVVNAEKDVVKLKNS